MEAQHTLYTTILNALQQAGQHEQNIKTFLKDGRHIKPDDAWLRKFDDITTVTLPDCMGRLIGMLNLHTPFLNLGRYIRSFADAAYVAECLQEQMIARLAEVEVTALPINRLMDCCHALTDIESRLTAFPSHI